MYPNTPLRSGKSRSQRVAWATVLEFHSRSARSRIGASPWACRSVQYSWNQPTCPISQSMGLTIGSIGPINCRIDRSSVARRVHVRTLQSWAASSSAVAALVGRYIRLSFMKIVLITPARSSSRSGNQTTSMRWMRILRELYPDRPLIVGLSGTDIYDYIDRDPAPTLRSLACADRLVALQELVRR